jgi:hypothetical protein
MSRAKGKVGEREIAAILRELTGWNVQRLVRQHDRDCDLDVPGWAAVVKRHATAIRSDIAQRWAQAVGQAHETDRLPVLFYRANRHPWRAVWPLAARNSPSRRRRCGQVTAGPWRAASKPEWLRHASSRNEREQD